MGFTEGDDGTLSSVGLDLSESKGWNEKHGIDTSDEAVFFLDPAKGPAAASKGVASRGVVVAQLTCPATFSGTAEMAIGGRSSGGGGAKPSVTDFHQKHVQFHLSPSGH